MKRLLVLLLLLSCFNSFSQNVKVLPGFKVKYTNVWAVLKESSNKKLGLVLEDHIGKDSIKFYIASPGYDVNAVRLIFTKGKIIPQYYNWSDHGLGTSVSNLKSYEIILNRNTYKLGDTITGRIKAVGYLERGGGQTYEFSGDFRHIIENTPEVRKKRKPIQRKAKTYTPTGFYTVLDHHDGDNFKLPQYVLSGDNFYLYTEDVLFGGSEFSGITRTYDLKKQELVLKLKIKQEHVSKLKYEKEHGMPVGVVVDNVLIEVMHEMVIDKENNLVIKLKAKDKKEADRITQALQRKIAS